MSSFRSPPFRWLWSSSLAAFFGAGMQTTATAWLALDSAGGAFAVGLVLAARMLPNLLFGLAAGTLADRAHRGRQLGLLQQTLIQLAVPEEQRGRAVGVWVLGIGSAPLGHLEMGSLVTSFGAPLALSTNGCLVLAAAATLLARAPAYRPSIESRTLRSRRSTWKSG